MQQHVELRRARLADIDAVLALERATEQAPHWARATYAEIARAGELREGASASGPVRRCIFVAERASSDDGVGERRIVGFAVGAVRGSAELESVAVAAGVRRAGLGHALCEAVIAWCLIGRSWEQGAAEIMLEVRAASAGAIALYAGLGYREVARRPRYYRDPEDDAVVMRLALK